MSQVDDTPTLKDFCEHCRPLAKQILDDLHARLLRLKELTEPLPKGDSTAISIPAGEPPR